MFDPNQELSAEEVKIFYVELAKTAVKLFSEDPVRMTYEFEIDREIKLGVSKEVYRLSVQMKNALTDLIGAIADSLIENDKRDLRVIVLPNGEMNRVIMDAISGRYWTNMDFPEFTIPFGEAFKELVKVSPFVTKRWQLVDGEGKAVSFQAIGEKIPLPVRTPRKRATAVRYNADTEGGASIVVVDEKN